MVQLYLSASQNNSTQPTHLKHHKLSDCYTILIRTQAGTYVRLNNRCIWLTGSTTRKLDKDCTNEKLSTAHRPGRYWLSMSCFYGFTRMIPNEINPFKFNVLFWYVTLQGWLGEICEENTVTVHHTTLTSNNNKKKIYNTHIVKR